MRFRLENILVGVALIALPFLFGVGDPNQLRDAKIRGVIYLCTALGSIYLWKNISKSFATLFFIMSWNCIYTGYGSMPSYPLVFIWAIVFASVYIGTRVKKDFIYELIVWSGSIVCVYAYIQMLGMDFIFTYAQGVDHHTPTSFMGQQTLFGAYIASTSAVALLKRKWVHYVVQIIPALFTISSFTIGSCVVALFIFFASIDFWKTLKASVALFCLVLLAWIFFPHLDIFFPNGRPRIWMATIDAALLKPWIGYGGGSFQYIFPKQFQPADMKDFGFFIQAHNEYVQCFFEFGIIGVIGMIALLVSILKASVYALFNDKSILPSVAFIISMLFNSIGNFPLQLSPHNIVFAICLVILLTQYKKNGRILNYGS